MCAFYILYYPLFGFQAHWREFVYFLLLRNGTRLGYTLMSCILCAVLKGSLVVPTFLLLELFHVVQLFRRTVAMITHYGFSSFFYHDDVICLSLIALSLSLYRWTTVNSGEYNDRIHHSCDLMFLSCSTATCCYYPMCVVHSFPLHSFVYG